MKVYVDDVGRHFARAKAEGAQIVSEPQDGSWGGRTYRALDHEGHRWEICQRGRDLAAERWQLPPGVTRGSSDAAAPSRDRSIAAWRRTLDHIALAVSDPDRTATLFATVFNAARVPADGAGPPEVSVMLGDLKLVFVKAATPGAIGASHVAFNAPKSGAEGIRNGLAAAGLKIRSPSTRPCISPTTTTIFLRFAFLDGAARSGNGPHRAGFQGYSRSVEMPCSGFAPSLVQMTSGPSTSSTDAAVVGATSASTLLRRATIATHTQVRLWRPAVFMRAA